MRSWGHHLSRTSGVSVGQREELSSAEQRRQGVLWSWTVSSALASLEARAEALYILVQTVIDHKLPPGRGYLVSWVSMAEGKPLRAMSLQHSQHRGQGCLHPKRKQSGQQTTATMAVST